MAARTLHEHFRAVLPVTYDEKGVIVHEITTPDEHLREVRFTWEGDSTSNVYGAYLQRTDRGWSVRRYDAPLLDLMSAWLSRERLHPFEELLDALHNVSKAAAEFDVEHRNEEVARFRQGRPIPEFRLTREGIERMLETPLPDSIEYGVTPADLYTAPVVWVRLRADTTVVCAERHWLAPSSSLPIDFRWVDEGVTPTCRHGFSRIQGTMAQMHTMLAQPHAPDQLRSPWPTNPRNRDSWTSDHGALPGAPETAQCAGAPAH